MTNRTAQAQAIWAILVDHCRARDTEQQRDSFIHHFVDRRAASHLHLDEFRFGGSLGSGGKFYEDDDRWWIACYPEDTTPEREAVITKVNALLMHLRLILHAGDAFRLFTVYDPGRGPRTRAAVVDGWRALTTAAVSGGVRWAKDDARGIQRCFAIEHGGGGVFRLDETTYALAIASDNVSACSSLEHMFQRKPWKWPGRVIRRCYIYGSGFQVCDAGSRLAVGFDIRYYGADWRVTSLNADRMTICQYRNGLVEKRKTFTRAEMAEVLREAKKPLPEPDRREVEGAVR